MFDLINNIILIHLITSFYQQIVFPTPNRMMNIKIEFLFAVRTVFETLSIKKKKKIANDFRNNKGEKLHRNHFS